MLIETKPQAAHAPTHPVMQRLDPVEYAGWDELLESHPEACFFHTAAWAKVLHKTYGHRFSYMAVIQLDELLALVPVAEVASPLTGRRGVSLPYSDFAPALFSETVDQGELIREVLAYGEARQWRYFEARDWSGLALQALPSVTYWGHRVNLSVAEDQLLANLEPTVRTAIRKSEKSGVQVEFSRTLESIKIYYSLHCETRKRHGLPPQPYRFFQAIFEEVLAKGRGWVIIGKHEARPVAAVLFVHFGKNALFKYGASDKPHQNLRANNLVMWEAIKWYHRNGYLWLDLGRTGLADEGLRRFKRGWGAVERRIDYFKYDFAEKSFVLDRDRATGWHNHIFRRMPAPLARMAGALLYKHLS